MPWLRTLRLYLALSAAGNLLWETLQLPLYTIGRTGSVQEQTFAVLHCTAGDVLIATVALAAALVVAGNERWPAARFVRVTIAATIIGVVYTGFSEWRNVYVHAAWSYAEGMPLLPVFGVGLGVSPLLQWLIVPPAALHLARAIAVRTGERS